MPPITASLLYALVECPHRVWLDATEDPAKRDEVSPFIELLWERGSKFEREHQPLGRCAARRHHQRSASRFKSIAPLPTFQNHTADAVHPQGAGIVRRVKNSCRLYCRCSGS